MNSKVSVVKCQDYSVVEEAIEKSLDLIGGLNKIIKPGDKVLLKINLLAPKPVESAVTTNPAIVAAMINIIQGYGGIPIVGDASGMGVPNATKLAYKISGIEKVVQDMHAEFVNFETAGYIKVNSTRYFKDLFIAKPVLDADVVISLPKLKTHSLMLYTGAVKNFFGVIPVKNRRSAHLLGKKHFGEAIIDIYSTVKPDLAVLDGVVGMEGDGPISGKPKKAGIIVSSFDCASLDIITSKIIGFDPFEVPTNLAAFQCGICSKIKDIEILGESIENVKIDFKKPTPWLNSFSTCIDRLFGNLYHTKPYIDSSICTGCKICISRCPVGAIKNELPPKIDTEKCIICFCCHELCTYEAVRLKKAIPAEIKSKLYAFINRNCWSCV